MTALDQLKQMKPFHRWRPARVFLAPTAEVEPEFKEALAAQRLPVFFDGAWLHVRPPTGQVVSLPPHAIFRVEWQYDA